MVAVDRVALGLKEGPHFKCALTRAVEGIACSTSAGREHEGVHILRMMCLIGRSERDCKFRLSHVALNKKLGTARSASGVNTRVLEGVDLEVHFSHLPITLLPYYSMQAR